jgi:hypothetical protein
MARNTGLEKSEKKPRGKSTKRQRRTKAIERAEMYISKNLARYITALEELAVGVMVSEVGPDGERVVYSVKPDRQAIQYLLDRGMGKPPQQVEVTGEGGGPMEIAAIAFPEDDFIEGEAKRIEEQDSS